jgi:hypothetical protein
VTARAGIAEATTLSSGAFYEIVHDVGAPSFREP